MKLSTADKTSHGTMNVHHRLTQFLSKSSHNYIIITAPSHGDYKTKDLWDAIFCYIMIMYTLHNYNDNCPGPEMDKAKNPFH